MAVHPDPSPTDLDFTPLRALAAEHPISFYGVRAREILGWSPVIQLEQGLNKTIAYFDALLAEA